MLAFCFTSFLNSIIDAPFLARFNSILVPTSVVNRFFVKFTGVFKTFSSIMTKTGAVSFLIPLPEVFPAIFLSIQHPFSRKYYRISFRYLSNASCQEGSLSNPLSVSFSLLIRLFSGLFAFVGYSEAGTGATSTFIPA